AWVLREACAQALAFPKHLKMAVNVSTVQLKQHNFVETVVRALGATGLAPNRLELEITESVLADQSGSTLNMLHKLSEMG
ncbi:EAL domain-containing protein, partial [Microbacteriaceae bacterium K1510]|nr:EAL domain-containing protein [Microbacteriaceae bacterium K1510]